MFNKLTGQWNQINKVILYVLAVLIFAAPIFRLILMSFTAVQGYSFENYTLLLQEERTIMAIKNTLVIVSVSNIISVLFGSVFAFLTAYTNIKRKRLLELLVIMPFIIPSYIITLSWTGILRTKGFINELIMSLGFPQIQIYSIEGIIFVLGICNIPIVYLSVVHMLRKVPRDLEWASRASGYTKWQTIMKINLIQVMPAILGGSVLAFLSAIDNFSVPAFLGISSNIPVLSTYIYEKAISFGPGAFRYAAALSVMLSIIAVGGTFIERFFLKKSSHLDSIKEDYSPRIEFKDKSRRIIELILIAGLSIFNIVPVVYMIASSFLKSYGMCFVLENLSLDNFQFVFASRGVMTSIRNSLLLALITCVACILTGTAIAYFKVRKNNKAMELIEKCASLTYAIPGIVLALSMIFHWVQPVPGFRPNIYGTINILIIAYITRYLILQIKGSTVAMLSIEPSLEEAAMVSGTTKLKVWLQIIIPLLARPVLASSFLIFVSSLTELTLSSMLAAAGTKTIGLTIFNFQQAGDYNLAAAMSSVVVVLVLGGYFLSAALKTENNREVVSLESDIGKCNSKIQQYSSLESN